MATAAARDAQPTESPGGDARVGDRVRDPRRDARLRRLILAVVALATAAPLLWVRYLPFTDLPEHVAAIATLARLLPGGGGSTDFVLSLRESQYLVYDLVGALLTRALGDAALANRLLLAAVAVAWPFSLVALLRALDRDERVALFAPMIFWNRALTIGFLPFVASVPLAVFALATLVRQLEAPTKRGHALVAALAIVLFYTHVSAYVLFAFAGGVMTIVRLRRTWRSAARLLAMLVPSGVLAAVWWLAGSLGSARSPAGPSGRLAHTGRTAVDAVPLWAFDVWRSHLDELWASLWWIAFALVVIAGLKRKPDSASIRAGLFALVPLACALLIYALTPFHVGPAGYLDVRLAPLLALFSLLLLRPSPGRAGDGQVALAVVAALGTACTAAYEMQRVEHEMLGELDALLAKMKPGSRLATLNFEVELISVRGR